MNRFERPVNKSRRKSFSLRQALVVVAVGSFLGAGALGIDRYIILQREAAAAVAPDVDVIYTGSILYTPSMGSFCRQLLFDNRNGEFADNGYVDCDTADYHSAVDGPKHWSAARVRVISNGFSGRS